MAQLGSTFNQTHHRLSIPTPTEQVTTIQILVEVTTTIGVVEDVEATTTVIDIDLKVMEIVGPQIKTWCMKLAIGAPLHMFPSQ